VPNTKRCYFIPKRSGPLNMLVRLFELKGELNVFLINKHMNHLLEQHDEPKFGMQVAYHSNIFAHSNQLSLHPQYFDYEKLVGTLSCFKTKFALSVK